MSDPTGETQSLPRHLTAADVISTIMYGSPATSREEEKATMAMFARRKDGRARLPCSTPQKEQSMPQDQQAYAPEEDAHAHARAQGHCPKQAEGQGVRGQMLPKIENSQPMTPLCYGSKNRVSPPKKRRDLLSLAFHRAVLFARGNVMAKSRGQRAGDRSE